MKRCTLLAAAVLASLGLSARAMPSMQGTALRGEVLEVLSVPTYTYMRLKTKDGETWAAVQKAAVKKGDQVTRGQAIAKVRSSDPAFLHFEVRQGFDSVDPMPYLQ